MPTLVHSYPITGIYLAVPSEYRQLAFRVGSLACFCFNPMERCENQITAPTSDQLVPAIIRVATARRLTIPGHCSRATSAISQTFWRITMCRSEERRVGKECVSTGRARGSTDH